MKVKREVDYPHCLHFEFLHSWLIGIDFSHDSVTTLPRSVSKLHLAFINVYLIADTYNEEKQEEHEKLEEAKRQLKTNRLDQMIESGETSEIKVNYSALL